MAADAHQPNSSDSLSASTLKSDGEVVMSGEFERPLPEEDPGRYDFRLGERGETVELGRGGLGQVLAARDVVTGRVVALKQLWKSHLESADSQTTGNLNARFLREARITAQLEHPAIVPVYELGRREDDALYYTMRRIHGRTLHRAAQEARTLAARLRLLPAVVTVCRAVAYAHSRGVLHRDIKPQNVMLGPFGETYLLDWGLSRRIRESATEPVHAPNITGATDPAAIGTPAYMSPEQAYGTHGMVDERSDVFGLGTLLFELLTGSPPRTAQTAMEAVIAARSEPLPKVASLAPELPPELAAICDRALMHRPGDRYGSAGALADDLENFLHGRTVAAYHYRAVDQLRRFVRQHRAVVAVGSVAVLALLVMGGAATARIAAEQRETESFARLMLTDISHQALMVSGETPLLARLTARGTSFWSDPRRVEAMSAADRGELASAWNRLAQAQIELGKLDEGAAALAIAQRLAPPDSKVTRSAPLALAASTKSFVIEAELQRLRGDEEGFHARLLRAREVIDRGPTGWVLGEWHSARQAVYAFLGRWEDDHGTSAQALASYRVDVESAEFCARAQPEDQEISVIYVQAMMDLAVRYTDAEPAQAVEQGARAVAEGRRLAARWSNNEVMGTVASLVRQQALILRTVERTEEAARLEAEARPMLERALKAVPDDMGMLSEYGDLLLQQQDYGTAATVLRKAYDQGERAHFLSSLLTAELGADHAAEVIALAPEATTYEQKLYVALAYLRVGRLSEAAPLLQSLKTDHLGALNWPKGVVSDLARRAPAPAKALLADFGPRIDRAATGDSDQFTAAVDGLAEAVAAGAGRQP